MSDKTECITVSSDYPNIKTSADIINRLAKRDKLYNKYYFFSVIIVLILLLIGLIIACCIDETIKDNVWSVITLKSISIGILTLMILYFIVPWVQNYAINCLIINSWNDKKMV